MQTSQLTDRVLRRLAETRVERGAVLTLYVDLDPARFADAGARASQVRVMMPRHHDDLDSLGGVGAVLRF